MPIIKPFTNKQGNVPTNAQVCDVMYKHLKRLRDSNNPKDVALLGEICGNHQGEVMGWLESIYNLPDEEAKNKAIGETILPIRGVK